MKLNPTFRLSRLFNTNFYVYHYDKFNGVSTVRPRTKDLRMRLYILIDYVLRLQDILNLCHKVF